MSSCDAKSADCQLRLGYPFNFVAQGIGTRRPCVMTLTPDPEREKAAGRPLEWSWKMISSGSVIYKDFIGDMKIISINIYNIYIK
jgi:hypothetical protein